MATGPLQNLYHRRLVASTSQKPCFICYKATATVLITPDNRDFFYVCTGHLGDKGFATAVDDTAGGSVEDEKKKKDEELQKEIEKVKEEYAERVKRRKEKKAGKDKDKDKDKDKKKEDENAKKEAEDEEVKDAKERDDKIAALKSSTETATASTNKKEPRIYTLNNRIYQMRVSKLAQAQQAKRRAEQLRTPGFFPSVPKGPV